MNYFIAMKHKWIINPYASNPKVIACIKRLESQIKKLTGRLILLKFYLNQNSRNIIKQPFTNFLSKINPIPIISTKRLQETRMSKWSSTNNS